MKPRQLSGFTIFFLCILVLYGFSSLAADETSFDSTFYHIYTHTASESLPRALQSADSLYYTASTDVNRVRALMLIGDVYHRMANRDSVIHYAQRAARIAERSNIYAWQARIYGVLSTQHREMGLLGQGRKYLALGMKASERMGTPDAVNQFKGQVFQETGFYDIAEGTYEQGVEHFKQSNLLFEQLPTSAVRDFGLSQNEERLGFCYTALGMLDSALLHYRQALDLSGQATAADTPVKGHIYNGLGRVYLAQGDPNEAIGFLNKALAIADVTEFPNLQISVYQNLADYYRTVNDMEAYTRYNERYLEANRRYEANHRGYTDQIVTNTTLKLEKEAAARQNAIILGIVLLVGVGMGIVVYVRIQRQKHRRFEQLIQRMRARVTETSPTLVEPTPVDREEEHPEREIMPESTRRDLLKKLAQFEESRGYRDRNLSIALLAGKMKTNTKYLSHVINKDKQKDFNTYINALRVEYVIYMMTHDPQYLKYKISFMAEDAGFSSHSKFTTVFKNVAGLSPSTFMDYLKKKPVAQHEESVVED